MRYLPLLLLAACVCAAQADDIAPPPPQETRVEFGVGLGGVHFPDYTGASEKRTVILPFPYFVVHSRFLDVDRNRVRGKLFKDDSWSLDLDFGGNVSVSSSDTQERRDMPDLDWLGEVGPALRYRVWRGERGNGFDLVLPARVAMSVRAATFHHRGYVSDPRAEWRRNWPLESGDRVTLDANLAAVFVDRSYAEYYYGVAPQYATATRPAYQASGGYGGWHSQLGVSWHRGAMVYGAFIEHSSLHGAAFQNSPLVSEADGWSFGVAVAWVSDPVDD